jgi:hypothetical protein
MAKFNLFNMVNETEMVPYIIYKQNLINVRPKESDAEKAERK